jgi:hypothetical protein
MDEKSQEKKSQEKHYDNSNQVASFYKLPLSI